MQLENGSTEPPTTGQDGLMALALAAVIVLTIRQVERNIKKTIGVILVVAGCWVLIACRITATSIAVWFAKRH